MNTYILSKSVRKDKKYMVVTPDNKKIHFGAKGYNDFTTHSENNREIRKKSYIARHKYKENWNKSGINNAGFWARYISWNKPTLKDSIRDTEKKFKIKIILK